MTITIENKTKASRHLVKITGLDNHILIGKYIDIDKSPRDWGWTEINDEDRLSSGELVIIGVLRTIVLGWTGVPISDLAYVDEESRRACLDALRLAYFGDEVPTL